MDTHSLHRPERRAYDVPDTSGFPPTLLPPAPYVRWTGAPPLHIQLAAQVRTSGGMVHAKATVHGPVLMMPPDDDTRIHVPPRQQHPSLVALLREAALVQRDFASSTEIAHLLGWNRASVWKALGELSRAGVLVALRTGAAIVLSLRAPDGTATVEIRSVPQSVQFA